MTSKPVAIYLSLYCFFAVSFQTDKPVTLFLVETLEKLLRGFYAKFIEQDVLENAKTTTYLLKIDVYNRSSS